MSKMDVIFNNTCPICSREVALYEQQAQDAGLSIRFSGIEDDTAREAGLSPDEAAQRFHVVHDGQLHAGLDAFRLLWAELPRWRWLAKLTGLPIVRPVARLVYDHVAAPILYALHRRRQRRL